ncbi:MAG: DUF2061 domain-containing protein [Alphaproteobacteria bacterium]|nr:DUF2061 domain-containing protein [Alphaproteobacteria bacterium]
MRRDLLKTATYGLMHVSVAFTIAYLLTGSWTLATGLALIEPGVQTVAFFLHERAWKRVGDGPAATA